MKYAASHDHLPNVYTYKSFYNINAFSVQFSSVAQSCPTLCDPMDHSMPGLPVHHQLPEFTQTHIHRVSDATHPSHPLLSPSPPAPNPSQHQSLFQCVNSSHEVAKVLEFYSRLNSIIKWINEFFKKIKMISLIVTSLYNVTGHEILTV